MSDQAIIETTLNPVIVEGESDAVLVEVQHDVLVVLEEARQGPTGPQGPQGDPGPSGSLSYVWDQAVASASWLITHNLGVYPSVTVVDSTDRVVEGAVNYVDSNNIRVDFNAPFTGQAFLN